MKIPLVLVLLLACITATNAQRIKGSDTVLPLTQKEAEDYMGKHPEATVTVTGGGTGVGISALLEGTTDIAMASRRIKFSERQKVKTAGSTAEEIIVAYDALAVIVHPSNKISRLTREQLEGIFRGKIKNWKELGGDDLKIIPYSRETSSGTYEFFKESALNNKNYMSGIMSLPATGSVIQSISQTKGAIGYVGLAYMNKSIKALKISYDGGTTYTEPTVANATNKLYPIVRPLYYYYTDKTESVAKPFIDYLLSPQGQQTVAEIGFVPVK